MKTVRISGTENYAEEAPELLKRYERVSFADRHRSVMQLILTARGRVLDIGAGTGRDGSPTSRSSAASIAVSKNSRPTSPLSFRPIMPIPSRSSQECR